MNALPYMKKGDLLDLEYHTVDYVTMQPSTETLRFRARCDFDLQAVYDSFIQGRHRPAMRSFEMYLRRMEYISLVPRRGARCVLNSAEWDTRIRGA